MDTLGEIARILIVGDIAVVEVVYHLGNAAHIEADAGDAAGHRLDNGIRQVVLHRGYGIEVNGIIDHSHQLLVGDILHGIDGEGNLAEGDLLAGLSVLLRPVGEGKLDVTGCDRYG